MFSYAHTNLLVDFHPSLTMISPLIYDLGCYAFLPVIFDECLVFSSAWMLSSV